MLSAFVLLSLTFIRTTKALQCPANGTYVAMPELDAVQFSYEVQISVQNENTTFYAYEFYDKINQTIHVGIAQSQTIVSDHVFDMKRTIYDYKYNQTFIVEENNGTSKVCTVEDLNSTMPHGASLFGVGIEKGLSNVKNAFYWNGNNHVTYKGNDTVIDGIPTNQYQTCLSFDDGNWTYLVDVYFSVASWTMPYGQKSSPVRLSLNATDNRNNASHLYTYSFYNYQTQQTPRAWTLTKPHDVICPGRKDAPNNTFQPFPTKFRFEGEVHRISQKKLSRFTEAYDFEKKLFRRDYDRTLHSPHSIVHDFNQGLAFVIDQTLKNCSITPLPINSSFDTVLVNNNSSLVRLRSPEEFTILFNLTFGGYRQYGGVPAQVWIGQNAVVAPERRKHGEKALVYETFYFSNDTWSGVKRLLGISHMHVDIYPILLRRTVVLVRPVDIYQVENKIEMGAVSPHLQSLPLAGYFKNSENVSSASFQVNTTYNITNHARVDVFNYEEAVRLDSFDVSLCFSEEMKQTIILKFKEKDAVEIKENIVAFNNAFLAAVAEHANITPLRVKLDRESYHKSAPYVKAESGGFFTLITLAGVPDVKGDSFYMKPQTNLTDALAYLQAAVQKGDFKVSFVKSNNEKITMSPIHDYWMTEENLFFPPSPSPRPPSPSKGTSAGAVVAVAFLMIVIGLVAGYVIRSCRAKRRGAEYTGLL